ncbi:MAG TPA: LytTR family DNA-binding domain-containing protein [Thermoanaerobaculia bacterium]|jgi:two-component system LytT family response regulator|nr:LytTR family DNA-binding domain-containing protein [Thermoanaerobaculia bacterium]
MNETRQIRAVIADDEPLARRGIRQLLATHPDVAVVAEARNGRETVQALRALQPDLLFLDVQMPGLDGFAVLREHGAERMPVVIFVTAHDEFAVRAFEAHALDYLVKPVAETRFAEALERARGRLRSAEAVELARRLAALLAAHDGERAAPRIRQRVRVPTSAGELVLETEEIDWIEADDYYAAIHARGRRHLLREPLASLEQRLDGARFVRVHRSAIVNIDRVRELRSEPAGETVLVLRDGSRVPVSRRRREQVAGLLRRLTE